MRASNGLRRGSTCSTVPICALPRQEQKQPTQLWHVHSMHSAAFTNFCTKQRQDDWRGKCMQQWRVTGFERVNAFAWPSPSQAHTPKPCHGHEVRFRWSCRERLTAHNVTRSGQTDASSCDCAQLAFPVPVPSTCVGPRELCHLHGQER
jgi:hypothetical protein